MRLAPLSRPCQTLHVRDPHARPFAPCVYILASGHHGTLYIGVTSDLVTRWLEHQTGKLGGFTAKYGCKRLVYVEPCDSMAGAITREKPMKKWRRAWKIRLIEEINPHWKPIDPTTGLPSDEVSIAANLRGGYTDGDGQVVAGFDQATPSGHPLDMSTNPKDGSPPSRG